MIADERREISACMNSQRLICCDVIKGLEKEQAFNHALRTLCPDIVLTDEIAPGDIPALERLAGCGVYIGATVHARSVEEIRDKYGFSALLSRGVFDKIAVLRGKTKPGTVEKTVSL